MSTFRPRGPKPQNAREPHGPRRALVLQAPSLFARSARRAPCLALGVALVAVSACEEAPAVRVYEAPAYAVPATVAASGAIASPTSPGDETANPTGPGSGLSWSLPTGWTDTGETNEFRVATLATGEGDARVEVAVSRVPGQAGSIAANVNRWRRQLGLGPADRAQVIAEVDPAPTGEGGLPGMVVTIANAASSPPAAQRIAWFEQPDGTWYLKATGTPAAVERETDAINQLLASLRPGAGEPSATSSQTAP